MIEQLPVDFSSVIKDLENFYQNWIEADFDQIDRFYSLDVEFVDPATRIVGLPALRSYFLNTQAGLSSCRFHFSDSSINGNSAYLSWQMRFSHPKLKRGRELVLDGVSQLHFDPSSGRICFHRDYFDLGAMLYEHVPLLGRAVGAIKQRLAQHAR